MLGSAAFFTTKGAFAEALAVTPEMTEGPFYPDKLPLDQDNDLVIVSDRVTPAVGEITHLHGRVTDVKGQPVKNALVEIWQVDARGHYLHSRGMNGKRKAEGREPNFQGYGRFETNAQGEYRFRTIRPVSYPGRTPHIHVAVDRGKGHALATQCFVKGEPQNKKDGLIRRLGNSAELLVVGFEPVPESKTGELLANFNIVLGKTPPESALFGAPLQA